MGQGLGECALIHAHTYTLPKVVLSLGREYEVQEAIQMMINERSIPPARSGQAPRYDLTYMRAQIAS